MRGGLGLQRFGEIRTCWRCGCAQEECECKDREVHELVTLAPSDQLLEEITAANTTTEDFVAAVGLDMKEIGDIVLRRR